MAETKIAGRDIGDGSVNHLDLSFSTTPVMTPPSSLTAFIVWDSGTSLTKKVNLADLETYFNSKYALTAHNQAWSTITGYQTIDAIGLSNAIFTGGGTISVSSIYEVKWSQRFILISNGMGSHFSTSGYFDISMPALSTVITGVGGATNKTVTANGIPLAAWESLYYILPIGSNSGSIGANFRVVFYTSALVIPNTWLKICTRNSDGGYVEFANGISLRPDTSLNTNSFDVLGVDVSGAVGSALILANARTINGVSFNGSANITIADSTKLPLSGGTLSLGSVGGTTGNVSTKFALSASSGGGDNLEFQDIRTATGSDWLTAGFRIQHRVDATFQAYIQFNGGNNSGMSIGTGSSATALGVVERLKIDATGLSTFTGNVVAPNFIGALTGNSTTSTNLNNSGTVTLASAIESNSITITQPAFTTNQPVKLINFNWYGDSWSIGNIRSGGVASSGLGVYLNGAEQVRFTSGGNITAPTFNGNLVGTNCQVSNAVYFNGTANYFNWDGSAGAINTNGNLKAVGSLTGSTVYSSGSGGFACTSYVANGRSPMYYLGDATPYGLSYFQGTAGLTSGVDTIGIHFGTATAAGSQFAFQQNGNLRATGAITANAFFSSSDMRLKDIVEDVQFAEFIHSISYTWKDKSKGKRVQTGYSAQEVKKYMPNAVNEDENGMLSVNYIQVLVAKVQALEKQLKKLQDAN
jgi:hypothetical protein